MPARVRERLSDTLLHSGFDRALQRQELERRMSTHQPTEPGYGLAQRAVRSARRRESATLWLAWRLHPRSIRG